ncbi:ABC transporter substrate-binding protein [Roseomonas elaeocarpi]|uniref:ABC transporter substrate-binding protein n=1 Tax=Roseomonas elaeocarpi TaxID=907779 RepID=A0ABV6JPZ5_9PROT
MRRRSLLLGLPLALGAAGLPAMARAQGTDPAAVSGKLTLYTSQLEADAAQTVEAFRKRYPNVQVDWLRGGTNDIMPRLRAEIASGTPRADVLLLADALTMESLAAENRLRPSPEVQIGNVPAAQIDGQRRYFATKLITTGIAYNTRAPFAPKRWADLVDARTRNLVTMPSPAVSGAAALHLSATAQDGALGWDYLNKLVENGVQARGGNGQVMQAISTGERPYGIVVDYLAIRAAAKGAPVRFVFPEDGVSAVTEPAAILSSTQNAPAAIAFVSFLLSRDGQELASRQGFLPADPKVAPPEGFPDPASIKVMPLDAARALRENDATLRRFNDLLEQR